MNDDKNSSSLNNSKKKKRHSSTTNSTNKNDRSTTIINNNNNNINEPFTSHQYRHDGTNLNNTLPFNTEGHSIYNESRIIDTPTNNISINSLTNSVLSTEAKNNMGIFSQNNVNTMMNNIIQQILSTLSAQQERMNNIQQQGAFTPINVSSSMNASLDGKEDQQKIQTCNGTNVNHHQQQKQETPPSSSYSMNNQLVDGSNYSSFNNGSGDVGQASSSLTSSSRSSSNNTTNSSLSITSSSSSSFVNNNDSKKYTFSSGNTSSTLEFINALSTAPTNQSSATTSSNVQHEYNDQLSDGGISQLFDECAHSTFNIDPSSSSLTTKSTSEFNLEDYQDLFSDRSAVREFGDDTSCNRQEPNVTQSQTNNNNNRQQSNPMLDNINEPMLWGMLRQMLTSDNEGAMSGQYSLNTISNLSNGSGSSNDSNSPYIQNQQMSTANTSSTPTIQSSTINFGQNNFQSRAPQAFNNNAQPPNNVRNLISTLFDNLNNGRQMHPGLKITSVIPDFKLEEEEEDESEDDNQLSNHPGDPPTIDSTKQILGSIRKTLSNKSNPAPNQFQRQGFQQRPSNGFIKWLSEHSTSHNREQDNEVEEPHQPTTTNNMSHFKFYNEMLSDKNNALHSHPPNSESSINSTKVTKDQPSNASNNATNMKPLKIFQHDPHKPKKKKDLQNGEHILNFQSPQSSDNTTTTTTSSESSDKNAKRKRKEGKDSKKKTTNNSSKKKKE